jgi:AAA+ superfamily predicted ATPase
MAESALEAEARALVEELSARRTGVFCRLVEHGAATSHRMDFIEHMRARHGVDIYTTDPCALNADFPGDAARGIEGVVAAVAASSARRGRVALLCISGLDELIPVAPSAADTSDVFDAARALNLTVKGLKAACASQDPGANGPRLGILAACARTHRVHPLARAVFPTPTAAMRSQNTDCNDEPAPASILESSGLIKDSPQSKALSDAAAAAGIRLELIERGELDTLLSGMSGKMTAQVSSNLLEILEQLIASAASSSSSCEQARVHVGRLFARLKPALRSTPSESAAPVKMTRASRLPDAGVSAVTEVQENRIAFCRSSVSDARKSSVRVASSSRHSALPAAGKRVRWDDIAGQAQAKLALQQMVVWPRTRSHLFARLGLRVPVGVLLFGPPGTGKTLLAKAAATELQAAFFAVALPTIIRGGVGDSERALSAIFDAAMASAPSIIFLDELQSVFHQRADGEADEASRLSTLLTSHLLLCFDRLGAFNSAHQGQNVVVIGATNVPEALDRALLGPGRFDRLINVPLPSADERRVLLAQLHAKVGTDPLGIENMVDATEGFSGADLANLSRAALSLAVRDMDSSSSTHDAVAPAPRHWAVALRQSEGSVQVSLHARNASLAAWGVDADHA